LALSDEDTLMRLPLIVVIPASIAFSTTFATFNLCPDRVLVTSAPTIRMVPTGSLIVQENALDQSEPAEHPVTLRYASSTSRLSSNDLSNPSERRYTAIVCVAPTFSGPIDWPDGRPISTSPSVLGSKLGLTDTDVEGAKPSHDLTEAVIVTGWYQFANSVTSPLEPLTFTADPESLL